MSKAWFEQLTLSWLNKRIPASSKITLNRHNIFIFPTGFGVCYGICCLLLFLLGTNYQNNLIILFSMLLSSIFITSMLLSYQNLAGLVVQRLGHEELFALQPMCVSCQMKTTKPRYAIRLKLNNHQALAPQIDEEINVSLSIASLPRGVHRLKRITVSSVFPLGLYRTWSLLDLGIDATVFPRPLTVKVLATQLDDANDGAEEVVLGRGDNFYGLEEYQLGESLKRVAWKQVAQGRGMLTKQFSHGVTESQWLDFDLVAGGDAETKLSHLCYLVIELSKQNQPFGLILPNNKLEVGQGELQRLAALNLLANYRAADE